MMRWSVFPVLMLAAAGLSVSAPAADLSSLSAFVQSCRDDAKGCTSMTLNAIISARSAKYGCIPKDLSDEQAAERLLDWLKGPASAEPKYQKEPLDELMWNGIDALWACKKK